MTWPRHRPRGRRRAAPVAPAPADSLESFEAKYTGIIESRITNTATTFTIGSWFGRDRLLRIQIGSVWSAPAVKVVTITSSKLSANASSPPASSAVFSCGNVT